MRAKLEIYSIVLVFILLGVSCTDRNDTMTGVGGSSFTVKISGGMSETRSAAVQGEEGITIPLHLFLFKKGAADSAIPDYYQSGELKNNEATTMICTPDGSFDLTLQYDIYVVGCDENETISPTASKATLLSMIQENIVGINSGDKLYMLAGRTLDASLNTQTTEVKIVRNVCRLNLTLADESSFSYTDISVTLSIPDKTYVFDSGVRGNVNTLPTGAQNINQSFDLALDADTWEGDAFYFFENKTTVAGIKSDNDKVRLTITATGAAGQKKYSTYLNKAGGFITQRNTIYKVNATLRNGQINVETDAIPWDAEVNDDVSLDQVFIEPKANCYIVKPNGGTIYIPISQVNDASVFDSNIPPITPDERLTAELVWTDVIGGSLKGLAPDASVQLIELIGKGADAVLRVVSGSKSGNSVVAIKGADGKIKWSWHIWVTDYLSEQENGQNSFNGYIFMDRNLGAASNVPASGAFNDTGVMGLFYQWGRKDPCIAPLQETASAEASVYDANGNTVKHGVISSEESLNNMLPLVQNPFAWAWASNHTKNVEAWGQNGDKTVYDPCPYGWRVPTQDALFGWKESYPAVISKGSITVGYSGKRTGIYPISGTWGGTTPGYLAWPTNSYSWTATKPMADDANAIFRDNTTASGFTNYWLGYAMPVRCVRDWTKEKRDNEIRVMTAGRDAFSLSHSLGGALASNWQSGMFPLLSWNFGYGEPVNVNFKFYNNTNGNKENYNLIDKLRSNDIDVLCLTYPSAIAMSVQRAKEISDWLNENQNRVICLYVDDVTASNCFSELLKLYGLSAIKGSIDGALSVVQTDDVLSNVILNGPYGDVRNVTSFKVPELGGYWGTKELEDNGFVPILITQAADRVVLSINPEKRIILIGDSGTGLNTTLGTTGELTAKVNYGPYPILLANIWAWIANTVKKK